ncbi:uncharacterized protein LOC18447098 [Amborella trichopoda]|uniref:C2H2-type domain-containing protein n=1 Tax=Amborella trichopoda TaxID=13333 RepID=U5D932_AMBTC|nr:uncharacterized protein LOC18447098 [Amborella trichopoda]ERN18730.1 hypothetical protein AMTR_s00199p00026650 [Amborella trichopoda]|eukprot:XP_006857263.1 uncharacterized protein LOC18447098 [Amborella trichopoda]
MEFFKYMLAFTLMVISSLMVTLSHTQAPDSKKQRCPQKQSSWDAVKKLLTCKHIEKGKVHDPAARLLAPSRNGYTKLSSCGALCTSVVVPTSKGSGKRRVHEARQCSSLGSEEALLQNHDRQRSARGVQLRRLSGCYECRTVSEPGRYLLPRATICACDECGEVFIKAESLELHKAIKHAVSELGPEDSGRHIVEIIFQSSWLKNDAPLCVIDRILKIHNTPMTVATFEAHRDSVKLRAARNAKRHPRCAADGNELLRFHCTTIGCSLGSKGATSLCSVSSGCCRVCGIIRDGFYEKGICTTAGSGRAHDSLVVGGRRAMLVCRVIAGRVRRGAADGVMEDYDSVAAGGYDSVAGAGGGVEELFVLNPKAILPCFVVVYRT